MLISQVVDGSDMIQVVARTDSGTRVVNGAKSVYSLALEAARAGVGLVELIERKGFEGVYISGAVLSADLGLPDIGLTTLTEVAARIAGGERMAALPPPSGREVRRLTAAFDSMRRELEGRYPSGI